MATNAQVTLGIFNLVKTFADSNSLQLSIAGKKFDTPSTGNWIELSVSPNNLDITLNDTNSFKRGMFQINVCGKPDKNPLTLTTLSDTIATSMQKGTVISTDVKVTRTPYPMQLIPLNDRVILPVTIEYSE
jgi:hypothetical protein